MRIGIDIMGGDNSPQQLFQAVLEAKARAEFPCTFSVFATPTIVQELEKINKTSAPSSRDNQTQTRLEFIIVEDVILMEDPPLSAIRHKKKSSIVQGLDLIKEQKLNAFVTAGNTGALIAYATLKLPLFPQVERPALLAVLPTKIGKLVVLDVGGNTSCTAENLIQFARMGAAYQRCMQGIKPRIGLLNMGEEPVKGPSEIRKAYQILQQECQSGSSFAQFVGNIEGRDVFLGTIDVLVTEGFAGNIFLKTSEGMAAFVFSYLRDAFYTNKSEETHKALLKLQQLTNYNAYPGAFICGVEGIIVKCHGDASAIGMLHAIEGAMSLVKKSLVAKIKEEMWPTIR